MADEDARPTLDFRWIVPDRRDDPWQGRKLQQKWIVGHVTYETPEWRDVPIVKE